LLAAVAGDLWFGAALDRPFEFLSSFLDFTWAEILKVGIGVKNLHFPNWAFIFIRQEKSIIRIASISEGEVPTNVVAEAIAVIKRSVWGEWPVPVHKLQNSFLWKFPQHALVGGVSRDLDRSTQAEALSVFATLGPPHGSEGMIGLKCNVWSWSPISGPYVGILGHYFDDWRILPPIKFSWKMARVLEVNQYPGLIVRTCGHNDVGGYTIRTANRHVRLFAHRQSRESVFVSLFRGSCLSEVEIQKANSDQDSDPLEHRFQPRSLVWATCGFSNALFWRGWHNLLNDRHIFLAGVARLSRMTLLAQGLSRLITF